MFLLPNKKFGFTLLELLIVIAIIGILAAIVLVALGESREKSRNAAVIAQMEEIQKALELYRANTGGYPDPSDASASRDVEVCIGEGGGCWTGVSASTDADDFRTAMDPYLKRFQYFDQGGVGSPAYNGCVGVAFGNNTSCSITDYSVFFLLEGTNRDCAGAERIDSTFNGSHTMCRLMPD